MPGLDQKRVCWQNAPAEYEIANYDEPKIEYRQLVEKFIEPLSLKSLRKKTFYTIVTNVLCADVNSSKGVKDPIDKDLYLPLEIALTKWSINSKKNNHSEDDSYNSSPVNFVESDSKVWMINPGPPIRTCNTIAIDHAKKHKIVWDYDEPDDQNPYLDDWDKTMKEINQFLSADRTVFSKELRYIRQDLGCLKWLNQNVKQKINPINVYSLEDLYVVLMRKLTGIPESSSQNIARFRLDSDGDAHYNAKLQCKYHGNKTLRDDSPDSETRYCALALSRCYSNIIANDLYDSGEI